VSGLPSNLEGRVGPLEGHVRQTGPGHGDVSTVNCALEDWEGTMGLNSSRGAEARTSGMGKSLSSPDLKDSESFETLVLTVETASSGKKKFLLGTQLSAEFGERKKAALFRKTGRCNLRNSVFYLNGEEKFDGKYEKSAKPSKRLGRRGREDLARGLFGNDSHRWKGGEDKGKRFKEH